MNEVKMNLDDYNKLYSEAEKVKMLKETLTNIEHWSLDWNDNATCYIGSELTGFIKSVFPKEVRVIKQVLIEKKESEENENE